MGEVYHYVDKDCGKFVVEKFQQHRESGLYLDVTVKADGVIIQAHRAFLAAFSDYFSALFGSGMKETSLDEVTLEDVDGAAVAKIIEFAYTGEVDITEESVRPLLETANYLGVEQIRTACCSYLVHALNPENVVSTLLLANSLQLTLLINEARLHALKHFEQLVLSSEFLEVLSSDLLLELLSDDRLVMTDSGYPVSSGHQEQLILDAVLRYVGHDSSRHCLLANLLSRGVRLSLLSDDAVQLLKHHDLVASWPAVLTLIDNTVASLSSDQQLPYRSLVDVHHIKSRKLAETVMLRVEGNSQSFDDSTLAAEQDCMYVTGMIVYIRRWDGRPVIGGLRIFYSTGHVAQHGADMFEEGDVCEFCLTSGERITSAKVRAGWLVDQLTFYTSHDRCLGPFGGTGGGVYTLPGADHPTAYLAYLKGRVDVTQRATSVRHLSLVWAKYNPVLATSSQQHR